MAFQPRMGLKELSSLCRRVGTSLEAGVDARKTWSREVDRAGTRFKPGLTSVVDHLKAGDSVTSSVGAAGSVFPPIFHDLVKVGEQTGRVDRVLLKLSDHFQHLHDLKRTFLSGIVWPAIQLLMALGVIGLVILISGMVQEKSRPEDRVDLLGLGLMGPSGFITYLIILAVIFAALAICIRQWQQGKWGAATLWRLLRMVPALGNCIETFSLSRMAWTLSLTTDTPMHIGRAVASSLRSTTDPIYMQHEDEIVDSLQAGRSMYESMSAPGVFPPEFLDVIEVGETTGNLSESLGRLSRQYEERSKTASKTLTVVASFLVWGIVALFIIFFILRIAMFYSGMIQDMAAPNYRL